MERKQPLESAVSVFSILKLIYWKLSAPLLNRINAEFGTPLKAKLAELEEEVRVLRQQCQMQHQHLNSLKESEMRNAVALVTANALKSPALVASLFSDIRSGMNADAIAAKYGLSSAEVNLWSETCGEQTPRKCTLVPELDDESGEHDLNVNELMKRQLAFNVNASRNRESVAALKIARLEAELEIEKKFAEIARAQ